MKSRILILFPVLIMALILACPAMAAPAANVAQGKVLAFDKEKHVLTIDDYNTDYTNEHRFGVSTGKQSTYDTTGSMIGIAPTVGDVVRIAFDEKDGKRHAIRIMNVTKQDLMKK